MNGSEKHAVTLLSSMHMTSKKFSRPVGKFIPTIDRRSTRFVSDRLSVEDRVSLTVTNSLAWLIMAHKGSTVPIIRDLFEFQIVDHDFPVNSYQFGLQALFPDEDAPLIEPSRTAQVYGNRGLYTHDVWIPYMGWRIIHPCDMF